MRKTQHVVIFFVAFKSLLGKRLKPLSDQMGGKKQMAAFLILLDYSAKSSITKAI